MGDVMPRFPPPPFLKKQSGENKDINCYSDFYFNTQSLRFIMFQRLNKKICASFGNSILMGRWIVLCEFHFEAGAEEPVFGPFRPIMPSLPFCHSSICLSFLILIFYSRA